MANEEYTDSGDRKLAESFARCVIRHREAADLTQTQLSRISGLSKPYLWKIENGRTMANLRTIGRLAKALEVPVHILCEGVDASEVSLANRDYDKPTRNAE